MLNRKLTKVVLTTFLITAIVANGPVLMASAENVDVTVSDLAGCYKVLWA